MAEILVGKEEMVGFLLKQKMFASFIYNIYLHGELEWVRVLFSHHFLKEYLSSLDSLTPEVERDLLDLFVN